MSFDIQIQRHKILHTTELASLCTCWVTFWAGLIFFLGKEKLEHQKALLQTVSVIVVVLNLGVFIVMVSMFLKETRVDQKNRERRLSHLQDAVKLSLTFRSNSLKELRMWSAGELKKDVVQTEKEDEKEKTKVLSAEAAADRNSRNAPVSDWL